MSNNQDVRVDAIYAALTAEGAPFAAAKAERDGVLMPIIATAPPHLPAFFAATCAKHKDACMIVDGDQRFTYGEIYARAQALAGGLAGEYGVKRGDRIALAGRNSACWIVIYMAITIAGGVATLLNGFWQGDEMAEALSDTQAVLLFADLPRGERLAQSSVAHSAKKILFDDALPLDVALAPIMTAGSGATAALPELSSDDLATILFTSGSTGKSKGAYATHRQKVQGVYNYIIQTVMLLTYVTQNGDAPMFPPSTLINVPLFHITGEVTVFLQSFALGRKMVTIPKWDAREAMRLIEAERVTYFTGVPLMSFEILTHPDRDKFDLSSCRAFAAGGAPRPPEHARRFVEEMKGGDPIVGYGLTETNAVGCSSYGESYQEKPSAAGRATPPLVDLSIRDDAGNAVPQGQNGEICIRSIANFTGYWQNEAATREAFTHDGYFRTGDVGYVDETGYVFIIDRKKDMIIRGGEKITSLEVEAALYANAEVAESCVFGLPDQRYGEVPAAVISIQPGKSLTVEALRTALGQHLAAFKVPTQIWISDTPLPRLGTGKIDKVSLRKSYQALYAKGIA